MISAGCDLFEFVEEVAGSGFEEIILAADREALEAGRLALTTGTSAPPDHLMSYAGDLNALVSYLRYGFVEPGITPSKRELLNLICFEMKPSRRFVSRCPS